MIRNNEGEGNGGFHGTSWLPLRKHSEVMTGPVSWLTGKISRLPTQRGSGIKVDLYPCSQFRGQHRFDYRVSRASNHDGLINQSLP